MATKRPGSVIKSLACSAYFPRPGRSAFGTLKAFQQCKHSHVAARNVCLKARQPSKLGNLSRSNSIVTPVGFRVLTPTTTSKSCVRAVSTKPLPATQSRLVRFIYRTLAYLGFFALASGGIVLAFFVYDYTTYEEGPTYGDVPVPELALNPRRGGPKNLPIVECLLDDADTPEKQAQRTKPRLVVLGTGWASIAMLKTLDPDQYHVTVISPSNYFLFTPMLPSATVGTLEPRSLIEPVRRIIRPVGAHFLNATAEDVEFSEKLVEVQATDQDGKSHSFYVPYDKLILGVGKLSLSYHLFTEPCFRAFGNPP